MGKFSEEAATLKILFAGVCVGFFAGFALGWAVML